MLTPKTLLLPILFVAIAAVACSSEPVSHTPTAQVTVTATATSEPTQTPFPIMTQTPETSTPSPTTTATAQTATPMPAPSPTFTTTPPPQNIRSGGTLTIVGREPIAHQDVHQDFSPALSTWGPGIAYSRLMRFKSGADVQLPSLAVECDICEGWELEGGDNFVFKLRDDVRWQDITPLNGRSVTSDDIAFSYQRQIDEGANAALLQFVESVETPEPDTLRISLSVLDADFMVGLADGHSKIVAREAVEVSGDLRNGPTIGSGPWILISTTNSSHTFDRNPSYFEEELPYADRLVIEIIPDRQTREAALRARIVDLQQMEPFEARDFQQNNPGVSFGTFADAGSGIELAMKTTAPPFDDIRVRRGVFNAIDPFGAVDDIWEGGAYVSLGAPSINADWLLGRQELGGFFNNPNEARRLLEESASQSAVTITVGDFGEELKAHAERIAREMGRAGFSTSIETVNRRVFGDDVWVGGNYQMFVGPIAPITSPNGYLIPILHSQGRWNTTEHQDPELDALIELQAQELDVGRRGELMREIQLRAFENAYRFMPATGATIWAWWPRVQNFQPNFAGFEYSHWSRVWLRN